LSARPVVGSEFLGESSEHLIEVGEQRLRIIATPPRFEVPDELVVQFDLDDVVVLPP
jgi:hypothetical protein